MGCGAQKQQRKYSLQESKTSFETDIGERSHYTGKSKFLNMSQEDYDSLTRASSLTSRVDTNTRLFRQLVNKVHAAHKKKAKKMQDISLPKEKRKLEFFTLECVPGMAVPTDDEDWPDKGVMQEHFSGMATTVLLEMLKSLPIEDKPEFFGSVEEGIFLGYEEFKDVLPKPAEAWPDLVSDDAMSLIAFWGLGQLYLTGKPGEDGKPAGFEVDLTFLSGLETRPHFERYGAKASFGQDYKIESIYWSHGDETLRPPTSGDSNPAAVKKWEHAKWAWKASLGASATSATHLVQLHWIVVNATHVACRQELSHEHPVRKALKVFLYNTGGVNFGSTMSLYPEHSFLHRMSALTYNGLIAAMNFADKEFKYETHPEYIRRKNLGKDYEAISPMCADGLLVWGAFHKFFTDYIHEFYPDDQSVTNDEELPKYWLSINTKGGHGTPHKYGLPELSKKNLVNQMTHHAFWATCWHEFVGDIVQYLTTPEGLATKIVEGRETMDVQTFVQGLCLISLTGTRQPELLEDFSHLLPEGRAREFQKELSAELQRIADVIDAKNKTVPCETRRREANAFNPRCFACSVSV